MHTPSASDVAFKFEPGMLVRLRSGGPKMTVEEVGEIYVSCMWFGGEVKLSEGKFAFQALELVEESA